MNSKWPPHPSVSPRTPRAPPDKLRGGRFVCAAAAAGAASASRTGHSSGADSAALSTAKTRGWAAAKRRKAASTSLDRGSASRKAAFRVASSALFTSVGTQMSSNRIPVNK